MTKPTVGRWPQRIVCAVLSLAATFAVTAEQARSSAEQAALDQGREIAQLALGEDAASLWPRMGAQLQAAVGSAEGLTQVSTQVRSGFGAEQSVLDERIELLENGFHYRRVTRHALNPTALAVDVWMVDGRIEGLRLAPAPDFDSDAAAAPSTEGELPGSAGIQSRIEAMLADADEGASIVVAVRDRNGRRFIASGDAGDGAVPDEDTVFEAGSITKGLTGLLLAQMIDAGDVQADQTLGSLFPDDVALTPNLASITLEELATHRSGLPRLAGGDAMMARLYTDNPYAGSSVAEILADTAAVSDAQIDAQRGRHAYSNLGSALLGQLLARVAGGDFEQVLAERVFAPLALGPAWFRADQVRGRAAVGHSNGQLVTSWQLDAYAPAGAWRTTPSQLLTLGERLLASDPAWVDDALRVRANSEGPAVALAWYHGQAGQRATVWHNGATAGFASFLAIVPGEDLVVAVLANGLGPGSLDGLASTILRK